MLRTFDSKSGEDAVTSWTVVVMAGVAPRRSAAMVLYQPPKSSQVRKLRPCIPGQERCSAMRTATAAHDGIACSWEMRGTSFISQTVTFPAWLVGFCEA